MDPTTDAPHDDVMASSLLVAEALERILTARHTGGAVPALPVTEPFDGRAFVSAAVRHRVVPDLAPHAGEMGVPEPWGATLRRLDLDNLRAGMAVVRDADLASRWLAEAGLDALIVKGVALAAVLGQEPPSRGPGDLDLWIRDTDVDRVTEGLRSRGWQPAREPFPLPPGHGRRSLLLRFAYEITFEHDLRVPIDLHWRLVPWPGECEFDFDTAWGRAVAVPAVGPAVRTLHPLDALVHLAQHGRKERWPTLRHLADIAKLADRCDPEAVGALARSEPNLAFALRLSSRVAPWVADLAPTDVGRTRLLDEAWAGCLSLRRPLGERKAMRGRDRIADWVGYKWWLARSAPNGRVRASWAARNVLPVRTLIDPDPFHVVLAGTVRRRLGLLRSNSPEPT